MVYVISFPEGKGLGAPVPAQLASSSVEERMSRRDNLETENLASPPAVADQALFKYLE